MRKLRADEIECRVSTVSEKGCSLLLYKDARVDQRMLDEEYGPFNWKRHHRLIGDNLYCEIEIWDDKKGQWVGKEDVGTESFTEKEKGQASDSFKRAGFNWGVGRELYTAPFIWIGAEDVTIREGKNGKKTTYDHFRVTDIDYDGDRICSLKIVNDSRKGILVYELTSGQKAAPPAKTESKSATKAKKSKANDDQEETPELIGPKQLKGVKAQCEKAFISEAAVADKMGVKSLSDLTKIQYKVLCSNWSRIAGEIALAEAESVFA